MASQQKIPGEPFAPSLPVAASRASSSLVSLHAAQYHRAAPARYCVANHGARGNMSCNALRLRQTELDASHGAQSRGRTPPSASTEAGPPFGRAPPVTALRSVGASSGSGSAGGRSEPYTTPLGCLPGMKRRGSYAEAQPISAPSLDTEPDSPSRRSACSQYSTPAPPVEGKWSESLQQIGSGEAAGGDVAPTGDGGGKMQEVKWGICGGSRGAARQWSRALDHEAEV
eukprot:scaffold232721_cov31-Tisochrysis_lutea.AAC.1